MPRIIRLARPEDATAILEIYRPIVRETPISFETQPPSEDTMAQRVRSGTEALPWLVCGSGTGAIDGYAHASTHRSRSAYQWCAEVSVYVAEQSRGRGIGRDLYQRLFDCLRLQGYCNAYAAISLPNPPSVAFHQALGFEPIGVYRDIGYKLGRWHDVGWWALRLRDDDPPTPPRSCGDCRDEIDALLKG